jgi:Zinc finger, ZZ type
MLDIVGARFHCAVCDSVDICSNCESAGLPGNLTSPDGGHDSSHIMIKVLTLCMLLPQQFADSAEDTISTRIHGGGNSE